jgi:hypothetical protein
VQSTWIPLAFRAYAPDFVNAAVLTAAVPRGKLGITRSSAVAALADLKRRFDFISQDNRTSRPALASSVDDGRYAAEGIRRRRPQLGPLASQPVGEPT